jgi:phosphoribosyl 1,2-cyclic phosphodiesterase
MIEVSSLASGSSGNAYLFSANGSDILIDAGISARQLKLRLEMLGKDISKLSAVFVSHEHVDHIRALAQLNKLGTSMPTGLPIYMSKGTLKAYCAQYGEIAAEQVKAGDELNINGIKVRPFSKHHDAAEPLSFSISLGGKNVSYMTDIGHCCKNIREHIAMSDALFLESNHDLEMLKNGPYPHFLKQRILGNDGHLSNEDASMAVLENAQKQLKHVFLSHLSETNNTPDIALNTFHTIVKERNDLKIKCAVCNRHMPGKLVKV